MFDFLPAKMKMLTLEYANLANNAISGTMGQGHKSGYFVPFL